MEKRMAILMADLTGYTAMTEVHGASSAAAIVEKYLYLANKAMVGNSRLLERVGDQLVIISENPDDIATTSLQLMEYTSKEYNFLSIHAGVHYGNVLEQSGCFYGTSMNLTARIASLAKRNSILCSADFVRSVSESGEFYFKRMGEVRLKNIKSSLIVSELHSHRDMNTYDRHDDPVCHMSVESGTPLHFLYNNKTYHFCSEDCLHIFRTDPEQTLLHYN